MLRSLLLVTLVLAGCDSRSHGSSPVRRSFDNARALAQVACDCYERLGSPSRDACLSTFASVDEEQIACLEREYAANVEAAQPALECASDAVVAFRICLEAISDCDAMYDACTSEYLADLDACPDLPESVQLRFAMCYETTDADGDGIVGASDACPTEAEDFDGDADTDGCPDGEPADGTYAFCVDACSDLDDQCITLSIPAVATAGSFCTHGCAEDVDCQSNLGFAGACYDLEDTGFLCYQTCFENTDCDASSVCIEVARTDGTFDFVCVPDN